MRSCSRSLEAAVEAAQEIDTMRYDVLIAGGGIGGGVLAQLLARGASTWRSWNAASRCQVAAAGNPLAGDAASHARAARELGTRGFPAVEAEFFVRPRQSDCANQNT